MPRLTPAFFRRDVLEVAPDLIGVELHWKGCSGRILETEAYAEHGDPACHTASRPSARAFMRDHAPGTAYVYLNYGVHWLFNLLVKGGERDGLVLIRALEPSLGLEIMRKRRGQQALGSLCSGPGKLGQALAIDGEDHGSRLVGKDRIPHGALIRSRRHPAHEVETDVRIGISQAREFPWRFLAKGHPGVSVRSRRETGSR